MVETLKPCLMQKNVFELFALTCGGDAKLLGVSIHVISHAITHALVLRGSGDTEPNILFVFILFVFHILT